MGRMSILSQEKIYDIGLRLALLNKVPAVGISSSSAIDADGSGALRIIVSITPGSSSSIMGLPSANMTSEFIRELAVSGEERTPIITYREAGAT
jgi:hypothetical protein